MSDQSMEGCAATGRSGWPAAAALSPGLSVCASAVRLRCWRAMAVRSRGTLPRRWEHLALSAGQT